MELGIDILAMLFAAAFIAAFIDAIAGGGGLITIPALLMTGMPPAMMLPQMMIELAVYGLVAGLCEKYIPQKNEMTKLYMSLIIAMLAGRIVNGLVNTCILSTQGYTLSVFMSASFITCLPGIVIQLIVIPVLVRILNRNIYKQPEKVLA